MVLVQVRRLGVILVMGLALTGCMTSPTESASDDARQVCTRIGYENGSRSSDVDGSTDTPLGSTKWDEASERFNEHANLAARAARADPRWNDLSNAVTDIQRLAELSSTIENLTMPQADRDAAQAQKDAMNPPEVVRSLDQECRKAQAQ
ncbi:hypothetical protein [Streptomyces vietnamensis]|uniref:hypothetical protein n=1 Tax=Streptomyces vietnamensis TaxID=362257 RepID=UPI00341552CD